MRATRGVVDQAQAIPVRIPMSRGRFHEASILILESDGLLGLGEAPALGERGWPLAAVQRELELAARALSSGGPWEANGPPGCAVRTACLDLEGRRRGVPVATLLGGVRRSEVSCNALIEAGAPPEVAAEVERWAALGFTTFKLKALAGGGQLDRERLGAARWAAGAGAHLRLDFNGSLTPSEAAAILAGLNRLHLEAIEQPLKASAGIGEWLRLKELGPLAADEALADAALAAELARAHVALAIKIATVGGPAAALELADLGAAAWVASSYETSIGIAAGLHTALALKADPLACGLATRHLLAADLGWGLGPQGPRLGLPVGPGLGVELDLEALTAYRADR